MGLIPILQLHNVVLAGYILYTQYKVRACMGVKRNAYRVSVGKSERNNHLGGPVGSWQDNNKVDVQEIG